MENILCGYKQHIFIAGDYIEPSKFPTSTNENECSITKKSILQKMDILKQYILQIY